jgi:hypothetical protein
MFLRLLTAKLHQKGSDMSWIVAEFITRILKFVMTKVNDQLFHFNQNMYPRHSSITKLTRQKVSYLQSADLACTCQ